MMGLRLYAALSQKPTTLSRWRETYHPNRRWILDLSTSWGIQPRCVPAFLVRGHGMRSEASCDHARPNEFKSAASPVPVKIRSISSSGAMIESIIEAWVGERATLVVDRFGPIEGFVTWQSDARCGFLFANETDASSITYRLERTTYRQLRTYSVEEIRVIARSKKFGEGIDHAPLASKTSTRDVVVERLLADIEAYLDNSLRQEIRPVTRRINPAIDARPKAAGHSASLMSVLAIGMAATATAFSAGVLLQAPPTITAATDQARQFASKPVSQSRLNPDAQRLDIPAHSDRSMRVFDTVETDRPLERAAPIRQRSKQHLSNMHSPATKFASDAEAAAYDPYAGRVAKRLTGTALQSALVADRLATRELNLKQLRQVQADSAVIQVRKNAARPAVED